MMNYAFGGYLPCWKITGKHGDFIGRIYKEDEGEVVKDTIGRMKSHKITYAIYALEQTDDDFGY